MDYKHFVNSKFLFAILRHDPAEMERSRPVMVHVNYHPDKLPRMLAVVDYWRNGNRGALAPFPDGSEVLKRAQ